MLKNNNTKLVNIKTALQFNNYMFINFVYMPS